LASSTGAPAHGGREGTGMRIQGEDLARVVVAGLAAAFLAGLLTALWTAPEPLPRATLIGAVVVIGLITAAGYRHAGALAAAGAARAGWRRAPGAARGGARGGGRGGGRGAGGGRPAGRRGAARRAGGGGAGWGGPRAGGPGGGPLPPPPSAPRRHARVSFAL